MRSPEALKRFTALTLAAAGAAWLCGCAQVPRAPDTVRRVGNAELRVQHPACFQTRTSKPPKAFLVRDENSWQQFWGQGEEPPVINFDNNMVFVAFTTIGSEGPGSLDVFVLKFRETEDVLEVRVKELVTGTWPLSAGYSRAYHIVRVPRTDKPVSVKWRYLWGKRDEMRELRARDWVPTGTGAAGGWPAQNTQQGGWPSQGQGQQQGGWGGQTR